MYDLVHDARVMFIFVFGPRLSFYFEQSFPLFSFFKTVLHDKMDDSVGSHDKIDSLDVLTDDNSNNYTLNESTTFNNYLNFETTVKNYAKNMGFTVRLDSAKYNEKKRN